MKKLFSMVMAAVMCATLCIPGRAMEPSPETIYTLDSSFENIKCSASGEYAIFVPATTRNDTDKYLPVGRVDIPIKTLAQKSGTIEELPLEPETKEYIEKLRDQAIQEGCLDTIVTVFSPELLSGARGTASEFYYTTPSGREMKGEYVHAYDLERHITHVSGTRASSIAESLFTLGVIGAGFAPSVIPFIAAGISLLDYFVSSTGATAIGGDQDWCYMDIKYDSFTQFTYDLNGTTDWCLMLTTQKVLVDRIVTKQHYKVNETSYRSADKTIYPNVTYMTPSFLNPWDKAIASIPYGDSEVLSFEFAGRTYYY